jgi:hypothetical protein
MIVYVFFVHKKSVSKRKVSIFIKNKNLKKPKKKHFWWFFFGFLGWVFYCQLFRTSRKNNLKNHQLAVHEGEVYSCHQCAFSATWKSTLKRHVASKHELMRFGCARCDFAATRKEHLRTHEETVHQGGHFACHLCDFKVRP